MQSTNPIDIKSVQQEAYHRGNLSWKFHQAQRVIDSKYKASTKPLFVGNNSRQWGKSYWAVCKAIEQALKKPKAQIRYGAAFHSDLIEFIIPAFDKVLEDCPASIKGVYKHSGTSYSFPNGSKIKLVGLDKNPNGLRGNTLDLIIIDECGFVSNLDYIYKSVIIPATTHRPEAKIIFISTPPATPAHAFVDYCQKAEVEGGYASFTIFDNPMLDAATIYRLMKETGCQIPVSEQEAIIVLEKILESKVIIFPTNWTINTTFKREYLCEFVTDSDLAIIPEWKDEYVQTIEKDEYYQYYHKYVGMDLGVKDKTAAIFGYYDFKRASLIIEDEFETQGQSINTEIIVGLIRSKEKELWAVNGEVPKDVPFRRISDNNWPLLMADFSHLHNLTFIATNKDTLEAMINELRILVQSGRIIINPRCKFLIGCLKYGIWDNKKKAFSRSQVYGHFDHLAALIYLVRNMAQHTNPIPATHNTTHRTWMGNLKDPNKSHNAKTIRNALIPKKPKVNY